MKLKQYLAIPAIVLIAALASYAAESVFSRLGMYVPPGVSAWDNGNATSPTNQYNLNFRIRDSDHGIDIIAAVGGAVTNNDLYFVGRFNGGSVISEWTYDDPIIMTIPRAGIWRTNFARSQIGNINELRLYVALSTNAAGSFYVTNVYAAQFYSD